MAFSWFQKVKLIRCLVIFCLVLTSCAPSTLSAASTPTKPPPTEEPTDPRVVIPAFDHVVFIMLENQGFNAVIGSAQMPTLNALAKQYVLLTRYYAVAHPSLPNYLALISGGTAGITSDCDTCFLNQTSLPDLIEKSGRTWKAYQEDLPAPCFVGNSGDYAQKHDPFIYFNPIRTDTVRCQNSIVPLTRLDQDLQAKQMPNFAFISPNMCHSGHNCDMATADSWLKGIMDKLMESEALGSNSLMMITFDESNGTTEDTCCGLTTSGGRVPAVIISPLAKNGTVDDNAYTHYSFLKTILTAWNLPNLGFTSSPETSAIDDIWK